jgi:hypothetical protein
MVARVWRPDSLRMCARARSNGDTDDAATSTTELRIPDSLVLISLIRVSPVPRNDPSSATRPARGHDYSQNAMAGFATHG